MWNAIVMPEMKKMEVKMKKDRMKNSIWNKFRKMKKGDFKNGVRKLKSSYI